MYSFLKSGRNRIEGFVAADVSTSIYSMYT